MLLASQPFDMILQNWWYTTLLNTKVGFCNPLKEHLECDVLVIGGGMAGLHAALRLTKSGRSVVLLERNICGGSSTGKSAGFLTPDSELELSQLERRYGLEGAREMWSIPSQGVDLIVQAIREHKFDCDFQEQDSLFLGIGRMGRNTVHEEAEAREQLKFPYTLYDDPKELKEVNTGHGYTSGVRYNGTYGINPLLYCQELKGALVKMGVKVFESTEVTEIHEHTAKTHLGSIKAKDIIVCLDKMKRNFSEVSDYTYHAQTFMAVSEPLEDHDIRSLFPKSNVMCWDSKLVYSYYRLTGDKRLLLGGGSPLTTFWPSDVTGPRVIEGVIKEFRERFPSFKHIEFIQYWPGRIDTTKDLVPIVDYDERSHHIQYVIGCVGLPWAAFCGDFAARRLVEPEYGKNYAHYMSKKRKFFVSSFFQRLFGKMISFAMNNAYSKYLQRDR